MSRNDIGTSVPTGRHCHYPVSLDRFDKVLNIHNDASSFIFDQYGYNKEFSWKATTTIFAICTAFSISKSQLQPLLLQ